MKARFSPVLLKSGVLAALLPSIGCGSDGAAVDASVDGTTLDSATTEDADLSSDGAEDEGKTFPTYNIVDGGGLADGDSSVCHSSLYVTHSCCNGEPCNGFCEGLPDGSVRCSCFGIVDGCQDEGQVCCVGYRGCARTFICYPEK